ncbi:hypothetical protein MUP32_05070 [Candidatus Microgenomates bacterium]|nr:hypothetical protein [Candidatus Microgenomates bacterium]
MKKIFLFLKQEPVVVFSLSFSILLLSFLPLFYFLKITPPNTVFPLIHNHPQDYHCYLQFMRQALDGRWFFIDRYTPENFPARFVYLVYLLLGKVAAVTGLDLPLIYTLSRLIFGAVFLILIYRLIRIIYPDDGAPQTNVRNTSQCSGGANTLYHPGSYRDWYRGKNKRILAVFLTFFGCGFWTLSFFDKNIIIGRILNFWSEVDILERFTYIPHHLFAKMLMVASIILLINALEKRKKSLLFAATVAGFLCGLSSPFVYVNLAVIIVITIFFILFRHSERIRQLAVSRGIFQLPERGRSLHALRLVGMTKELVFFLLFSSLSLLYLRWVENSGFPWNHYLEREKLVFNISFWEYLLFSGLPFIFSLFAVPSFIKSRKIAHLFILSWLLEPWLSLFLLAPFFPLQKVRFLAGCAFIPMGIMGSLGMVKIAKWLSRHCHHYRPILLSLLAISSFIFSVNIYSNYKDRTASLSPSLYNVYLPNEIVTALAYFNKYTPVDSVVLSQGFMGNLVPAYAHNKVVAGHLTNTYQMAEKNAEVDAFFRQNDPASAKKMIEKYQVKYVFYSLDTDPPKEDFIRKLGLLEVYQTGRVHIFKTK